jgi:phosphatidylglycerophosphate synthase
VTESADRREIKSREKDWSKRIAAFLARGHVTPNTISFIGLACAFMGGAALAMSGLSEGPFRIGLLIVAIFGIQLRLLCNMLDGMVAVEHGKGGPTGPIWNELPDRLADAFLLAGAGYGALPAEFILGPAVGWMCAVLAVLTAYLRELGRGLGFPADFSGPLAKPQRMGALTIAVALSLFDGLYERRGWALLIGLCVIAVGTAYTAGRRTWRLAHSLRARTNQP